MLLAKIIYWTTMAILFCVLVNIAMVVVLSKRGREIMLKASVILVMLCLHFNAAEAQESTSLPEPFKGYNKVSVRDASYLGPTVLIDPSLKYKKIHQEPEPGVEGDFSDDDSYLEFKCGNNTLQIGFTNGLSEDPTFILRTSVGPKKQTVTADGTYLAISNSCFIYISGNSNQFYNVRRKFTVNSKGIREVRQPLYLVDEVCVASAPVDLRTQKCGKGESVAKIPKGEKVQILLAERYYHDEDGASTPACQDSGLGVFPYENYLVRSQFGLVGWVANSAGSIAGEPGNPLSCIIMNGD
ncbi:hypothetical protein L4X63_06985 [Geomonas sp. Red32]|uniref:hypothetical protein n=1 Tax=Geomonas sp. Red32 TaxID=2912856 RepID=UPI00202CC45D|nr:hypothetical protein [Geomonas sp. Red32]MCM0081330.1 hypothetical protein [Geomonas sp. Red32]